MKIYTLKVEQRRISGRSWGLKFASQWSHKCVSIVYLSSNNFILYSSLQSIETFIVVWCGKNVSNVTEE